jgi:hypothetical protein
MEIAVLICCNDLLTVFESESGDRLVSRLEIANGITAACLKNDEIDEVGFKHRVFNCAYGNLNGIAGDFYNRNMLLTGSVGSIRDKFLHVAACAGDINRLNDYAAILRLVNLHDKDPPIT